MIKSPSARLFQHTARAILAAAGSLLIVAPLLADEEKTSKTQIVDTMTDRTPAITAFPSYPRVARRDRIEGDATICFRIDKRGRIHDIKVLDVSHRIFRRPALSAVRQSSFEPLAPNQVLATGRNCRTFRFRLEPILTADQ